MAFEAQQTSKCMLETQEQIKNYAVLSKTLCKYTIMLTLGQYHLHTLLVKYVTLNHDFVSAESVLQFKVLSFQF